MYSFLSWNKRNFSLFILILAGETIFFLPFVLARIFRPTLLLVFDITNTELGTYFSIYGIVALVSYFFGGPLADRFPARNLMSFALWLTGAGGGLMFFMPIKGTTVGLISVIGFTPDIFMSPWMGSMLDNNPGPVGHRNVFLVLSLFALFGLMANLVFMHLNKTRTKTY